MTKFFVTASKLWLSENADIVQGCTLSLRSVATDCIPACAECRNLPQLCSNVFAVAEGGLKYQYHNAWKQVLCLLGVLFEVIGPRGVSYMHNCLKSLADLRDSFNFTYTSELEYTIGKAIRTLGPEAVLKAIPLSIPGREENEFRRSWLVPVLKDNVQTSTIRFFVEYFLPMASFCE